MTSIRRSCFETNSSAYAFATPLDCDYVGDYELSFKFSEFGLDFDNLNPCDYLYTVCTEIDIYKDEARFVERLKEVLDRNSIKYTMEDVIKDNEWVCYMARHIDHVDELYDFIDNFLSDDETLLRFLYGGIVVYSNDNNS